MLRTVKCNTYILEIENIFTYQNIFQNVFTEQDFQSYKPTFRLNANVNEIACIKSRFIMAY